MPFTDQPQLLLFFLFASVMILSSLGVIFHPNAITAAVLLVLSFFSLAAIYAVMNAIFIATMQLLVYAGAIMVLVVFVLMLLSLREDDTKLFIFEKPIKKLLYLGLVLFLGVLLITAVQDGIPSETATPIGYARNQNGEFAGYSFRLSNNEVIGNQSETKESGPNQGATATPNVSTENVTTPNVSTERAANRQEPVRASGNTAVVGSAMFLRYLLPFELISVLLLAAVLGAVVLGKKNLAAQGEKL
ncbi:NADH-quinone oxidoreductase subunit J [Leptospira santarosai]|uniref:NADH-quinone oxidoreductase subunit J family protein n=1 Tax=Leptospira santarosai TaxID=28183 RepID=UPI0024AFF977|nr:NADH-quinone oxidoreductase subunit J [Leptospira santarosai]MDI7218717.1 NADH-quinone oxidoreductase subunit J [Leptospira santarosai]